MRLTDREYQQAKELIQDINILDTAENMGMTLEKKGSYYTLKECDSIRINPNKNIFTRNSNGAGGGIVEFICEFTGRDKKEVFMELANKVLDKEYMQSTYSSKKRNVQSTYGSKTKIFELPPKDTNNKNIIAYLTKTRKIDIEIVVRMIKKKYLYQDTNKNCVFVGNDENGKPCFASKRGSSTYKKFVGDVAGSNYDECLYINNKANTLIVAESPIDMMSIMTILKNKGRDLKSYNFLSLGGVGKVKSVINHISKDENIDKIIISLDNDVPGIYANIEIKELLYKNNFKGDIVNYISKHKDFNEDLCNSNPPAITIQYLKEIDNDSYLTYEQSQELINKGIDIGYVISNESKSYKNNLGKEYFYVPIQNKEDIEKNYAKADGIIINPKISKSQIRLIKNSRSIKDKLFEFQTNIKGENKVCMKNIPKQSI